MNVEIRDEAHLDISEGVAFYDRQSHGAGEYFYQRIFDYIESLSETTGNHEAHFGYHREIATRHPFLIYYRLITTGVEVVADLDGRSRLSDIDAVFRLR